MPLGEALVNSPSTLGPSVFLLANDRENLWPHVESFERADPIRSLFEVARVKI